MMKTIELNDLITNGDFYLGLKVGLRKDEIERVISKPLGIPDIETTDVNHYIIEMETGINLSIIFDKEDICFEIKLNLEENSNLNLIVQLEGQFERINEDISFEKLITIISKLNVEWEFDERRVYLQTICIRLKNGLRLYYAFGNKLENDHGLFLIGSILEPHKFSDLPHKQYGMSEINNLAELNVLRKSLYMIKFGGDEDDISELVRSPIFADIFERVDKDLKDEMYKLPHFPEKNANRFYIEDKEYEKQVIKKYLENIDSWIEFDIDTKLSIVKSLLVPFQYNENTLNEMIRYSDTFHLNTIL